jgi:hypothetical protein
VVPQRRADSGIGGCGTLLGARRAAATTAAQQRPGNILEHERKERGLMIPLVVALWEGAGYQGRKRLVVEDTPNLDLLGFNDQTSAVGIHPGPDYGAWQAAHGQAPFAVLYDDNDYEGNGWIMTGELPDIGAVNFGGISSVRICPPITRDTVDVYDLGLIDPENPGRNEFQAVDATISPIPLVVELYVDAPFRGHRIVIVENSASLASDFGAEFAGSASSVQVLAGPDYTGQAAILWDNENFAGHPKGLPPGSYADLTPLAFNDAARSITVR